MSQDLAPTALDVPRVPGAMVEGTSGPDPRDIAAAIGEAFETLGAGVSRLNVEVAGPPRAIYHAYSEEETRWTLAFPITAPPSAAVPGEITVGELPGGPTLRFTHVGPYERLAATYGEITAWLIDRGHMSTAAEWIRFSPMWEEYIDDPDTTPPDRLRTYIYLPRPSA